MMVKLLMAWDIKDGRDAEYFEFVVREWVPGITKLGLQPTEAWFTLYGEGQQVLTGGIAEDLATMKEILNSEEWQSLQRKLRQYVENYRHKIVRATGTLQLF
ncbi:MAG TPA: hypothetical protein PK801_02040 [Aggregatilineales bacterium]|jgi:hypothetical protein|nr:hypothetical protein [Chloroflexota bacterium]HOA23975.1 hypothetical protein [Aggregatilineales bacterium]HPV05716.1 hypothetical protein [Aggregatilineales bacterium]HQA67073.1 hypothetical protein [Aggregatilineales bacterium]HQE18820.1 hypothetical protein [Aggregatilineales bacterium]